LDPGNTELLRQKQTLLGQAVNDSKKRLEELNNALKQMESAPDADKTIEQQNALKREIIATEQSLEDYEEQLRKCHPVLETFAVKSAEVAEKTKALSGAAAGIAGAMVGNAVAAAGAADDLNALAQKTGFTVEELQKMQYASDVVDVSMEQMTGSIMKMTKQMSSGNKAFAKLGVEITNADGSLRSANEVWYESLEALGKVESETERDALSMELFGKSAMDMAGVVDDGGQALRELGDEAESLGLIMSQDVVDDANQMQDAIDKVKGRTRQAFLQMGASLAKSLVPAFERLVDAVTKVVQWFSSLRGDTQKIILVIAGLVAAISPVASLFSKVTNIVNGLSSAFAFFTSPAGLVVAAIAAVIAIGVKLYQNWDTIKGKLNEFKNKWSSDWNAIKSTFTNIWDGIKNKVSGTWTSIKNTVSNGVQALKDMFKFKWELPKIELPHFFNSGNTGPLGLPKIEVEWYSKAMKNGMILDQPTIFGASNGKLLGAGEAGAEVIIGANSLYDMIRNASQGTVVNMTVNGGNVSANELAEIVMDKLTTTIRRNNQRW
jgi:phage-related minor tail protein